MENNNILSGLGELITEKLKSLGKIKIKLETIIQLKLDEFKYLVESIKMV